VFYKPGAKEAHSKRYMFHPPTHPWFCDDCANWDRGVEAIIERSYTGQKRFGKRPTGKKRN